MFFLAAAVSFIVTVQYGYRAGMVIPASSWGERVARVGLGGILATIFVGLVNRGLRGDPFMWSHWLLLVALTITLLGYVRVFSGRLP